MRNLCSTKGGNYVSEVIITLETGFLSPFGHKLGQHVKRGGVGSFPNPSPFFIPKHCLIDVTYN